MKSCPKCNMQVGDTKQECPACGQMLAVATPAPQATQGAPHNHANNPHARSGQAGSREATSGPPRPHVGPNDRVFALGRPPEEALSFLRQAVFRLGWQVVMDQGGVIQAKTKMSIWSFGEQVDIAIHPGFLVVKSTSPALVDWGKNNGNIKALLGALPPGLVLGPV